MVRGRGVEVERAVRDAARGRDGRDRLRRDGGRQRRAVHADAAELQAREVVEDPLIVEIRTRRRRVGDVDRRLRGRSREARDVDRATDERRVDDRTRRSHRAPGRGGGRRDDVERDLLARRVAEAHLDLAVDGQEADLVGNVGEEQHRHVAVGDAREICVEATADADVILREVELADDQELAVRGDLHDDLAVEDFLGGEERVDAGRAGDRHRRGEGRQEPALARVGSDRGRLERDLLLEAGEPLVCCLLGRQAELGVAQRERILDRRQRLEELHTGREIVQRQPELRDDDHAGRKLDVDEDGERAELAQPDADREAAEAHHRESALQPEVEDPLRDGSRVVERADDLEVRVELQDAADELCIDLAAEEVTLDAHGERVDRDDRELALRKERRLDAQALDRAREREAADALDAGDARGEREDEVFGVVVEVGPLDADRVDANAEDLGDVEARAGGRADAEEDTEAGLRLERPVAEEGEVPGLARDVEPADGHVRADRLERDELLVVRRAGVEHEVAGRDLDETAEVDRQRVDPHLERVDVTVREGQLQPDRLGVR